MQLKKATFLLVLTVVSSSLASPDADPQSSSPRRRLVVRKRKRPTTTGQQHQQFVQQGYRDGRSLLASSPFQTAANNANFGHKTAGLAGVNQLSTFAHHAQHHQDPEPFPATHNHHHRAQQPVEPKVPRFSSFNDRRVNPFKNRRRGSGVAFNRGRARPASAATHRTAHSPSSGHIASPQVPGLAQHRAQLAAHQAQIQAQLTLANGRGRGRLNGAQVAALAGARAQAHKPLRAPARAPVPAPAPAVPRRPIHPNLEVTAHAAPAHVAHSAPAHVAHSAPAHVAHSAHDAHQAPLAIVDHTVQLQAPVQHHEVHHDVHHEPHHGHHQLNHIVPAPLPSPVIELEPVAVHQGVAETPVIDLGAVAVAGERCIDKIVNVEETEVDEQIECHHSYDQKCHTTYTTDFEPQQEEKCEETFKKNCFIEYNKVAVNETVEFCHTPLVKDCNVPGPVECKTEYESVCETRYHTHQVEEDTPECRTIKEYKCETKTKGYSTEEDCTSWPVERCEVRTEVVNKVTPETACKKVPKEKCAPAGCGFVQGVPECFDKVETIIQEVPEEKCDLEPQRHCKAVTTLVPNLKPSEECVDVPKEVCTRSNSNPRRVSKPVVKKWCYTPTQESGLFRR